MAARYVNDLCWAAFVVLLYLAVRLVLWPIWERPLQWRDLAFAAVLGVVAFAVRLLRSRGMKQAAQCRRPGVAYRPIPGGWVASTR